LSTNPIRVRFAPSPTGHLHLGGARTALYDYLIAKQLGGKFVLRIEDTDFRRYVEGAEEEIIHCLKWLGMEWDEGPDIGGPYGPYRQSERKQIYLEYAEKLIESGNAFHCFCSPERLETVRKEQQQRKEPMHYDGTCRDISVNEARARIQNGEKFVIRFKTPRDGSTTVTDLLRGEIKLENKNLDDYILVKSDGWALYHLAAAVDDHLMKITHVIRGSEWLSTFPLHGLIHRAFGWEEPIYVHLSVFLKPSGKGKMSKREAAEAMKDGYSIFVKDLEELGYLPAAVVNWIALMGWSYDDHTEFFTMPDLIEKFSLDHLNPSPAAINFQKFDYFNGLHIRKLSDEDLASRVQPYLLTAGMEADLATLKKIAPIIRERLTTLDDVIDLTSFFFKEIYSELTDLVGKNMTTTETLEVLRKSHDILATVKPLKVDIAEPMMRTYVEESGYSAGQLFGILRVAITGQKISPPLFESMEILGSERVLDRIQKAIHQLEQQ
jgi:glutamyl-tRNA synthetase